MSDEPVLVVDLDGTLIRTDLLYETFWAALSRGFRTSLFVLIRLLRGRAAFKAGLAGRVAFDPAELPYNEAVLALVRERRAAGGRTALVTASDETLATAVAGHLGLFDEVHASDGRTNLKGPTKAAFLTERYGDGSYDYVGDSRADLPVWQNARQALTVGLPNGLRRAVEATSAGARHLDGPAAPRWQDYVRALRPHQWLKNVLVFLPVLAAHAVALPTWLAAVLAFVAFCLVASSVYVLNDLLDLSADRGHPRKRARPFASGAIPLAHGTLMAPGLLVCGLLVAYAAGSFALLGVLVGYFAVSTAYSVTLKRRMVIDICTLAVLYTVRIFAGAVATGIPVSVWLVAFSIFIFLSLAAVKREAEIVNSTEAAELEASRRAYSAEDLPIISMMAIGAGYVAVLVLALYVTSDAVKPLYSGPEFLWVVCPVLLYWISRMILLAHRGRMTDDPIVFAIRDRASHVCGIVTVAAVMAGIVL